MEEIVSVNLDKNPENYENLITLVVVKIAHFITIFDFC